jgi:hypothetical protein
LPGDEDDAGAGAGEGASEGAAETAACPGDEDVEVRELHRSLLSPLSLATLGY